MKAQDHPQQTQRLEALSRYDIVGSEREESYDEIVNLTATVCDTPVALVSFVDEQRQWFKAKCGLADDETPLEMAICGHAILNDGLLEIPDTSLDPRTRDNPLCVGEDGFRFYAGQVLLSADGLPLGTLCVLDRVPRQLNDRQKRSLAILSRQVMTLLELRLSLREQDILRREMDHRVKNSLQTISSMLRIYASRVGEGPGYDALEAIGRRVESISLLHEELHQTSTAERLSLDRYLTKVMNLLRQNLPENVDLKFTGLDVLVGSAVASAVAMILSEFVANAAKHAFPDGATGSVVIECRALGGGEIEVSCVDNGIGHQEAAGADPVAGLGVRIVEAAARQIGGRIERGNMPGGYRMALTFPLARTA